MKILIFGGSFDPIHQGHLKVADIVQKQLNIDEVWFTPCTVSRYGKKLTPFDVRVNMIGMSIIESNNPSFRVSMDEYSYQINGKMYDLATYHKYHNPNHNFLYLIGVDSLENIHSWYRSDDLFSEFNFVTVSRVGYDHKVPPNFIYVDTNIGYDVSSTDIRNQFKETGDSPHVTDCVKKYIREKKLYV